MGLRRTVRLVGLRDLAPSVRALTWRCVDGEPLDYVSGQWVNLYVPSDAGVLRRAYSIASAPDPEARARFEVAVTRVEGGHASLVLHDLELGATLELDGAHGFFTREATADAATLLVGTGTGVCPLRAMVDEALRQTTPPPIQLLFGCRSEQEILYAEDFARWAREHPSFTWRATLSQPSASWVGLRGYVQHHIAAVVGDARPHVYVCGLQKMIKEVRRVLKDELGYERRSIHSERYD